MENFEKYLMNQYPNLFYKKENGELDCPCGVWVPFGWQKTVNDLCSSIYSYIYNTKIYKNGELCAPPEIKIDQAKEKFSDLRFYVSGGDEQIRGMIFFAEHLCSKICQNTGEKGIKCQRNGWYATLSENEMRRLGYSTL